MYLSIALCVLLTLLMLQWRAQWRGDGVRANRLEQALSFLVFLYEALAQLTSLAKWAARLSSTQLLSFTVMWKIPTRMRP